MSLGNAEPTLNAHGMNAQEMCAVAEELSQFGNIFPFVTSRISTIPPDCRRLDIPKLSMGVARDVFYRNTNTANG